MQVSTEAANCTTGRQTRTLITPHCHAVFGLEAAQIKTPAADKRSENQ
jgi:hypothetical protein